MEPALSLAQRRLLNEMRRIRAEADATFERVNARAIGGLSPKERDRRGAVLAEDGVIRMAEGRPRTATLLALARLGLVEHLGDGWWRAKRGG